MLFHAALILITITIIISFLRLIKSKFFNVLALIIFLAQLISFPLIAVRIGY